LSEENSAHRAGSLTQNADSLVTQESDRGRGNKGFLSDYTQKAAAKGSGYTFVRRIRDIAQKGQNRGNSCLETSNQGPETPTAIWGPRKLIRGNRERLQGGFAGNLVKGRAAERRSEKTMSKDGKILFREGVKKPSERPFRALAKYTGGGGNILIVTYLSQTPRKDLRVIFGYEGGAGISAQSLAEGRGGWVQEQRFTPLRGLGAGSGLKRNQER